jgi:carboxyl-terminal processing protease
MFQGISNMNKRKNFFSIVTLFTITCSAILFASNNQTENTLLFDGSNKAWRSIGHGYLMTVQDDSFSVFNVTNVSSLPAYSGTIKDDTLLFEGFTFGILKIIDDTLILTMGEGKNYGFLPIQDIPEVPYVELTKDPVTNFEVFWHTFEENCCLFRLTNTNWKEMYDHYRPQVNEQTTDSSLFEIFSQMLKPLNDGHTGVLDIERNKIYTPGPVINQVWENKAEDLIRVITQRVDDKKLLSTANDMFQYGTIESNIGYLNIQGFQGFSSGYSAEDEISAFTSNLDLILDSFKNHKAIIIDVRFNGGGMDKLAFELAERFVEQKKISYYRQTRIGGYDDFSTPEPFYLIPDGTRIIGKPVILLTSGATASAADVCAMLFKDIPNATLIGETTYGIFSDRLDKSLPNGWLLSLSNEKYSSADWKNYEQIGISPDINVVLDTAALALNHDNILEKAIEKIRSVSIIVTANCTNLMSRHSLNVDYYGAGKSGMKISYRLPGTSHVQLSIYNLNGRKVAAIVDKVQNAGEYHIFQDGFYLPKGTYILHIKADTFKDARKVIIRK